jgi:hypothetical protein
MSVSSQNTRTARNSVDAEEGARVELRCLGRREISNDTLS